MWLCMNNKHKYNRILNAHTHRPFASDLHDELFDNSFVGWLLLLCSSTKWRKNNVEYVAYGVCVCLCVVYFIIICSNGPHIPRSVSHSLSNYLTFVVWVPKHIHTHARVRLSERECVFLVSNSFFDNYMIFISSWHGLHCLHTMCENRSNFGNLHGSSLNEMTNDQRQTTIAKRCSN